MTVTSLIATSSALSSYDADVLVVGAQSTPDGPVLLIDSDALGKKNHLTAALEHLEDLGMSGKTDEILRLPAAGVLKARILMIVGLGPALTPVSLRRGAGCAVRVAAPASHVALALPTPDVEAVAAVAEGAAYGAYTWSHRVPATDTPVAQVSVLTDLVGSKRSAEAKAAREACERAEILGRAVALTRDLVNDPPNKLTPDTFATVARDAAKKVGVSYSVRDEKALAKEGFGGIVGVGQGSTHPPRLVRLDYKPRGAKKHIALVGKGITFDSGGLSIKPSASMPEMKSDMAGAASVLGAVLAVAELGLNVHVTGWLALAENMPGMDAQRPSDVVTMYDGTTVEITNTDAEGRLVMADALAVAVEEHPDAILDVATLTGAQIIALGERTSGVMGDDDVRNAVVAAAEESGEAFWPMPLPEDVAAGLDSPYADLQNANMSNRAGGMLLAGHFLAHFVKETPWAHLDIAGPAFNESSPWGFTPTGGTGASVPTLVSFIAQHND
ncbi:leucyl aminopeptidase [Actinomyces vulturis]|uniref:leucyl aminopeptidase n=1 Tax=Actinomyces vulturis TaxID=1857645 RepID=UPI000B25F124|nr:leucyl aminopeptidase [Actinomyces vulturis]